MKKLLFIGMMCVMSIGTYGKNRSNSKYTCTAHYFSTKTIGGKRYSIYTSATASTCAIAMEAAKAIANAI